MATTTHIVHILAITILLCCSTSYSAVEDCSQTQLNICRNLNGKLSYFFVPDLGSIKAGIKQYNKLARCTPGPDNDVKCIIETCEGKFNICTQICEPSSTTTVWVVHKKNVLFLINMDYKYIVFFFIFFILSLRFYIALCRNIFHKILIDWLFFFVQQVAVLSKWNCQKCCVTIRAPLPARSNCWSVPLPRRWKLFHGNCATMLASMPPTFWTNCDNSTHRVSSFLFIVLYSFG